MGKENSSTIWPILYFEADWPAESYKFDFDVCLIKATDEILAIVGNVETPAWGSNNKAMCDFHGNTEWFLSLPSPKPTEHVSSDKIGISFEEKLQEAIVNSFLMCLRLIRQTAAIRPLEINNVKLSRESIDPYSFGNELYDADYFGINTDSPEVFIPETFQLGDLHLITDLWQAIIKLRRLDYWKTLIYKEEFFAACDKEAGADVMKKIVDAIMSSPAYLESSAEERRQQIELWTAIFREAIGGGDQLTSELYREKLKEVFLKKQEEVFSNRTRIGRALNLFFEGLHLPIQHSFLSMCLVLETIFTVEETEITYQFATRLANITGKTFEQRKDIFERARKVYRERSNIVHGRKSIETVEPNILKDAFFFARQSLQHILLDDTLMKLYSDPITSEKTKNSVKAIKAIKDYFRDLDLR
jgi:hypothetical protein